MTSEPRFPIGTEYVVSRGKNNRVTWTVRDIWKTYNTAGELVKVRYVASHPLMGQDVYDYDVMDITIAKGRWEHSTRKT